MTLVLLIGAGLLVRSLLHLRATPSGVDHDESAADRVGRRARLSQSRSRTGERALERTRALPGVQAAAITSRPPSMTPASHTFLIEGQIRSRRATSRAPTTSRSAPTTSPRRAFRSCRGVRSPIATTPGPAGGHRQSELRAPHFPGVESAGPPRQPPRGRCRRRVAARPAPVDGVWREIVGVVADVRQASLEDAPAMTVYRPFTQIVEHDMFLMVRARSAHDAASLVGGLQAGSGGDGYGPRLGRTCASCRTPSTHPRPFACAASY